MTKITREQNKKSHGSRENGTSIGRAEKGQPRHSEHTKLSSRPEASEKGEKPSSTRSGTAPNTDTKPYIVRKIKAKNLPTPTEAEETDACNSNKCDSIHDEDCNNHGCVSCSKRRPACPQPPGCAPRNQLVCCSSQPSLIKILAKLSLFLLLLASVCYSLFRVASGWSRRHEILTLMLLLLATRLVCKKNWFLPNQYWRNLDPCCDKGPRQVDVTVPSHCPAEM